MRASRGMGAIRPELKKPKKILRKDALEPTKLYAEGGETVKRSAFDNPGSGARVNVTGGGGGDKRGVGGGGRLQTTVPVGKDADIQAYIDVWGAKGKDMSAMGGVSGGGVRFNKRFAEGGESRVNEAGNYTKPGMRKALFNFIKGQATQGTAAGQWSARKAQLLAKQYKAKGGGYK